EVERIWPCRRTSQSLGVRMRESSPHVSRVPDRVAPGLRPDTQAVRLAADRNAMRQLSTAGVEHVDLIVVAAGNPELFAVASHVAHVRTASARDRPVAEDFV